MTPNDRYLHRLRVAGERLARVLVPEEQYLRRACVHAERLHRLVVAFGHGTIDIEALCLLEQRITRLANAITSTQLQAATRRPETNDETTLAADRPPALRRAS